MKPLVGGEGQGHGSTKIEGGYLMHHFYHDFALQSESSMKFKEL